MVRLSTPPIDLFEFSTEDVWTLFALPRVRLLGLGDLGPLLHGGRLVLVPYTVSRSPAEFLALLMREGVSVLNQTPSAFYQLMHADRRTPIWRALALRYLIFGGEALELRRLAAWYSAAL